MTARGRVGSRVTHQLQNVGRVGSEFVWVGSRPKKRPDFSPAGTGR